MFVAVTKISNLPPQARDHMLAAFRKAAPDLKGFAGFLGFELWHNDDTLEAVSRWESREAMEAYAKSGMFAAHHGPDTGAPATHGAAVIESYEGEVVV